MWALAVGGKLEDRPVYSKGMCFDRFPFPDASPLLREEIATVAEGLDDLRSRVVGQNADLTMTGLVQRDGEGLGRGSAYRA